MRRRRDADLGVAIRSDPARTWLIGNAVVIDIAIQRVIKKQVTAVVAHASVQRTLRLLAVAELAAHAAEIVTELVGVVVIATMSQWLLPLILNFDPQSLPAWAAK